MDSVVCLWNTANIIRGAGGRDNPSLFLRIARPDWHRKRLPMWHSRPRL